MTFDRLHCNGFDRNSTKNINVHARLTAGDDLKMQKWIKDLEDHIVLKTGLRINKPRMRQTPFHSTIASVKFDFPIDKTMEEVNKQIKIWNTKPMKVSWFFKYPNLKLFYSNEP